MTLVEFFVFAVSFAAAFVVVFEADTRQVGR